MSTDYVAQALEHMTNLPVGWGNHWVNAAPNSAAIERARGFLAVAIDPVIVKPSTGGGVGMTFGRNAWAEARNDGSLHAVLGDNTVSGDDATVAAAIEQYLAKENADV